MNIQTLRHELDDIKVFQDLVDVLKSIAGSRYPKMKNKIASLDDSFYNIENDIYYVIQELSRYDLVFDEKFDVEVKEYFPSINQRLVQFIKKNNKNIIQKDPKIDDKKVCIAVVVGSNKGFCSSFNRDIIQKINETDYQLEKDKYNMNYICIGKKLHNLIRFKLVEQKNKVIFPEGLVLKDINKFNLEVDNILSLIFEHTKFLEASRLLILSNHFTVSGNKITNETKVEFSSEKKDLFPLEIKKSDLVKDYFGREKSDFKKFYPSPEIILVYSIGQFLKLRLFKFLLESETAENYRRLQAMSESSERIKDEISRVEKLIRKTRQKNITKQLTELMSASLALEKMNS